MTLATTAIVGIAAPAFENVRDAFAANFERLGEDRELVPTASCVSAPAM